MSVPPIADWEEVEAFGLSLPGTESTTTYRMPAVMVSANKRGFVWTSHEAKTSFAIWLDPDMAEMLMETDPATFWQSPHYAGSSAVLIRYGSDDPERVRHMIEHAYEIAKARPPAGKRRK